LLATKAWSWLFLLAVGVLTLGSLSLFYMQHVTVNLMPFDNRSELHVAIDLQEGSSVEATDAVTQTVARTVLSRPDVRSTQVHAGIASPLNCKGLVRHAYLRSSPEMGDVAIALVSKEERGRASATRNTCSR
jgi:multidrug efflux pump subunit AcrB